MQVPAAEATNVLAPSTTGAADMQSAVQGNGHSPAGAQLALFDQMAQAQTNSAGLPLLTGAHMQTLGAFLKGIKKMDNSGSELKNSIKKRSKEEENGFFSVAEASERDPGEPNNPVHNGPAAKPLAPGSKISGTTENDIANDIETATRAVDTLLLESVDSKLLDMEANFVAAVVKRTTDGVTTLIKSS